MSGVYTVFYFFLLSLIFDAAIPEVNAGPGNLAYSSASAYASASASASSSASASALSNAAAGSFSGHEGHKGIRSYDNLGYDGNNPEKGGKGCTKCKWENDDYWEKEEEETEPEERDDTECDDGDDGQYREHDYGHDATSGDQKLRPTGSFGHASSSATATSKAGSKFGTHPSKGGPTNLGSLSNNGPYQPSTQGWNSGAGTSPKPGWNQGNGNKSPGSWNSGPSGPSGPNTPNQFDGKWNNGPQTNSKCNQPGADCAQGPNAAGPVKQPPFAGTVPATGYNAPGSPSGCVGGAFGNCPGTPSGQLKPPSTGSYGSNPFLSSQGCSPGSPCSSGTGQGQYPGSGPSKTGFGSGPSTGPYGGSPSSSPQGCSPGSPCSSGTGQGQYPGSGPSKTGFGSGPSTGPYGGSPSSSPQGCSPGSPCSSGTGQGQYPGSGPSKTGFGSGPSTGPYGGSPSSSPQGCSPGSPCSSGTGQGQYPGSGPSKTGFGSGPSTGPYGGSLTPGNKGTPGSPSGLDYSSGPQSHVGAGASAVSSAIAGAGGPSSGNGYNPNHVGSAAPGSNPINPASGVPFGNTRTPSSGDGHQGSLNPDYTGVKGSPYDNKPGSGGAPFTSGTTNSKPANQNKPKDGDSKIFYINVSPVPGTSAGTKPHASTKGTGTTKSPYQPEPYNNKDTSKPGYQPGFNNAPATPVSTNQPGSYGNKDTNKPGYQSSPNTAPGIAGAPYQPVPCSIANSGKPGCQPALNTVLGTPGSPYKPGYQLAPNAGPGAPGSYEPDTYSTTQKPVYQSPPYVGSGTSKPSSNNIGGWPGSAVSTAQASADATSGCSGRNGACEPEGGCGIGQDGSSCKQHSAPGSGSTIPGSIGYPVLNPGSVLPGSGSSGSPCSGDGGCVPGTGSPTYNDKTKNPLPGVGQGSYGANPFLTGKISIPTGGAHITTTIRPIGQKNPFLTGNVPSGSLFTGASAGAWANSSPNGGYHPITTDSEAGPSKPVGKDNPFLTGLGHSVSGANPTLATGLAPPTGTHDSNGALGNYPFGIKPGNTGQFNSVANANSGAFSHGGPSNAKNPLATSRGTGSGGGVGVDSDNAGNYLAQNGNNGNSFGNGFPGTFNNAQASSFASAKANSFSGSEGLGGAFGQGNSGGWASSGANAASQATSGSWASSGASAYASSSANSWSGLGPHVVKA